VLNVPVGALVKVAAPVRDDERTLCDPACSGPEGRALRGKGVTALELRWNSTARGLNVTGLGSSDSGEFCGNVRVLDWVVEPVLLLVTIKDSLCVFLYKIKMTIMQRRRRAPRTVPRMMGSLFSVVIDGDDA